MLTAFLSIYLTFLILGIPTGFFILNQLERKREIELEQFKLQLESENIKNHNLLVREKLISFNRFLQEMALDFSLLFPTIDCSTKISPNAFDNKYQPLWNKISEIQLIADFYVPSIQEPAQELDKLATEYWQHLYKALVIEEGDRTSPDYLEAQKYAHIISTKIDNIRQKIREIVF
jgi:hypothetical protein